MNSLPWLRQSRCIARSRFAQGIHITADIEADSSEETVKPPQHAAKQIASVAEGFAFLTVYSLLSTVFALPFIYA
jgi:hypothetical protein